MTATLLVLNGVGNPVQMLAEVDGSGFLALHSVPQVAGAPVTITNPMPVVPIPGALTVAGASAFSVATGGVAVTAFNAASIVNGAYIVNPAGAATSLFVDMVNTPAAAAPGAHGTTEEIYAGSRWDAPGPVTGVIMVVSSDGPHPFTAVRY